MKNKGLKVEGGKNGDRGEPAVPTCDEGKRVLENLEMKNNHNQESDWDSLTSSPTSGSSILGSSDLGTNYRPSSSSSRSFSSGGCYSGSVTDEEENEDDGDECLDDWETLADALAAEEKQKNAELDPSPVNLSVVQSDSPNEVMSQTGSAAVGKFEGLSTPRAQEIGRAWRVDDTSRPQSLPNLSKQHSFPMNSNRHCTRGNSVWTCKSVGTTVPSSCPICCEELDTTDTNFCPCLCGFMLCLFCHKRILEEDGRCPGCRKVYNKEPVEGEVTGNGRSLTLRLARSFSMVSGS